MKKTTNHRILEKARLLLGVTEIPGPKHNPVIQRFHKSVNNEYIEKKGFADEINWCSSAACYVMESLRIRSPLSPIARHWLHWGKEVSLDFALPGDIAVFWRKNKNHWSGHVGFYLGLDDLEDIQCLGGNQRNTFCVMDIASSRLLGIRRHHSMKIEEKDEAGLSDWDRLYDLARSIRLQDRYTEKIVSYR